MVKRLKRFSMASASCRQLLATQVKSSEKSPNAKKVAYIQIGTSRQQKKTTPHPACVF
jgi:hypothetical protein